MTQNYPGHKPSNTPKLRIYKDLLLWLVSKDVKSLISHQPISKQKQNKKVVELRQIIPKDVMAYLYLPRPHDMPIFTLLLSTNASTCQDPSDPASWQMKDCQRQRWTAAESWWLLTHTSWLTGNCQVGRFIHVDQSQNILVSRVCVPGKPLSQQAFQQSQKQPWYLYPQMLPMQFVNFT